MADTKEKPVDVEFSQSTQNTIRAIALMDHYKTQYNKYREQNNKMYEDLKQAIENLKAKRDGWIGQDGEKMRQQFKDGLDWGIESMETLQRSWI